MPLVLLDKCVNLFAGWLTENWESSFEEQKNLFALVFFRVVARVSAVLRPTRYLAASKHRGMEGPFKQARGSVRSRNGEAPSEAVTVSEHGARAARAGRKRLRIDTSWASGQADCTTVRNHLDIKY